MQSDLGWAVSQSLIYLSLHAAIHVRVHARALRVFRKNKCRSVYSLSINLLEHFLSGCKCRLFVGKIWGYFSSFRFAFYEELGCVLRCFTFRFTKKHLAFYEAIEDKTSKKRLRFYMESVAFLYRNA